MSRAVMVDSKVLLDLLEEDEAWFDWSARQIQEPANRSVLIINPVIYAEISVGFYGLMNLNPYCNLICLNAARSPGKLLFWQVNALQATANLEECDVLPCLISLSGPMRQLRGLPCLPVIPRVIEPTSRQFHLLPRIIRCISRITG